jgi:hypothetical protein
MLCKEPGILLLIKYVIDNRIGIEVHSFLLPFLLSVDFCPSVKRDPWSALILSPADVLRLFDRFAEPMGRLTLHDYLAGAIAAVHR